MIQLLVKRLENIRMDRLRTRRMLFKYLRDNKDLADAWVARKIRYNYLGDLSDSQLVESVNEILRRREHYSET